MVVTGGVDKRQAITNRQRFVEVNSPKISPARQTCTQQKKNPNVLHVRPRRAPSPLAGDRSADQAMLRLDRAVDTGPVCLPWLQVVEHD